VILGVFVVKIGLRTAFSVSGGESNRFSREVETRGVSDLYYMEGGGMRHPGTLLAVAGLAGAWAGAAGARTIDGEAPGIPAAIDAPPAVPKTFAFTFSLPYGQGDEFPREPAEFERMLRLLKDAGFNTVHCPYTDRRHALFKKHGMRMMVDVLAWKPPVEADIRDPQQRPRVRAICEKVRDSDAVWGYNLWNERLDWCGGFKLLDAWIRMLRTWDPTHPVWVGTYRHYHAEAYPTAPGVHGWYDYHWARGMGWNFKMLGYYRGVAKRRGGTPGKWILVHDMPRNLYTVNTAVAHGVKTVLVFIGGPYAAREPDPAKRWNADHHLVRLGRHLRPLYGLVGQMGLPTAVYSTPTTRTPDNREKEPGVPADTTPFPPDHWLGIERGEAVCGFFRLPDGSDVVYLANHNAYAPQDVAMTIRPDGKAPHVLQTLDRKTGQWIPRGAVRTFEIALPAADARVLRFVREGARGARE
jgi:hypothetical protein